MINYIKGDLFTNLLGNKLNVILHICNDDGGWGSGFVVPLAKNFPLSEDRYREWYKNRFFEDDTEGKRTKRIPFKLGQIQPVIIGKDIVINMIAQSSPGGINFTINEEHVYLPPIRYQSFEECLYRVKKLLIDKDVNIVSPLMGCGLAGGNRDKIFGIVEKVFGNDLTLTVYEI